ncbi:ABC transporter permease [Rhizocola hellebori]|uniref:ABC transporter permease n=1 Tax=Rhizocola hellebori TaxID=1392758 RepID=UPI001EF20203|nr:ABC transporter permease [Rhizocola hellebori]
MLLAGLTDYNRSVIVAGGQSAVAAAPPQERAVLMQGPAADVNGFKNADSALRRQFTDGMGGARVEVSSAGYASGRQLVGPTGAAIGDSNGLVFASAMFLEGLPEKARLVSGAWATPGASPTQVVIAEPVSKILGLASGSVVPILDRRTEKVAQVVVSGVFVPQSLDDPYWLLTPEVSRGLIPGGATYGPFVFDQADFFSAGWASNGSAGWVIEPQLAGGDLAKLLSVGAAAKTMPAKLSQALQMGSSGQAVTSLDQLTDRLKRADLVGRSALLTPLLLIVVLGGYALLLLAGLLTEQRRPETALLRARGAARGQLAGLAAREAMLIAVPAAVLAPLLVSQLLSRSDRLSVLADANLHPQGSLDAVTWAVAAAAGVGCVLAMLAPALRGGATYVEDLAARSRPSRATAVQRAGVDLALIAFAVLAWFQLRQYSSPLAGVGGQLGIDPLLAAAAPIGVLAGSVLALRLLPPLTRLAEKVIDRRSWFATMLGMWQAGRRPHAGPVLLLALSVAVSTLAWALAGTAERSLVDQADHAAGADIRLTETSGFAPNSRAKAIAEIAGIQTVLPAWRTSLALGERSTRTTVMAFDAQQAVDLVKLRPDLGDSGRLLNDMAAKRVSAPSIALPQGVTELRGTIRVTLHRANEANPRMSSVSTNAIFMDSGGGQYRQRLSDVQPFGNPSDFQVKLDMLPANLSLAGFVVDGAAFPTEQITWELLKLTAVSPAGEQPVALNTEWRTVTGGDDEQRDPQAVGGGLVALYRQSPDRGAFFRGDAPRFQFAVGRPIDATAPVPVIASAKALEALHKSVGDTARLGLGAADVPVLFVGSAPTLPGTDGEAALLLDLPSLSNVYLHRHSQVQSVQEWWIAIDPAQHDAVAAAVNVLPNVEVHDRYELANRAGNDPYGIGARLALFIAALGAIALALVGIAVDVRATARRRTGEFAVLHTLGASPRLLARALVIEQGFLAGLGVLVGLAVGIGVAATMAPLVILTPTAARPIPEPILHLQWTPVVGTALLLLFLAMAMAAVVALTMRQRLAAAQLRIGMDR